MDLCTRWSRPVPRVCLQFAEIPHEMTGRLRATHSNTKIPTHQLLSVQLTTHRLLFICSSTPSLALENTIPPPAHLQVHLADIRQTEHYTGFLRSSSKITLQLGVPTNQNDMGDAEVIGNVATSSTHSGGRVASWLRQSDWTCRVCGFHNEAISATAIAGRQSSQSRWSSAPGATACKLCGVARPEDDDPGRTTAVTSVTSDSPTVSTTKQVPCPRCTYLNDPRLYACEICGAKLTTITNQTPDPPPPESIRISFRKGGDKEVYRRLKSVLASRTWEGKSKMGRMGAVRMAEAGTPVEGTSRSGTPTRGIGIGKSAFQMKLLNWGSRFLRRRYPRQYRSGEQGKNGRSQGCFRRPRGADGSRR